MNIKSLVLKQYKTGVWIGALRQLFSSAQFYLGFINFGMIAALAYDGAIGDRLKIWFPWMNFWIYMIAFIIGYALVCLFEWKVVFPSNVAISNQQTYKHGSPIKADFEEVKSRLDRIEDLLKK